jgi:ribulose-5-phosphate 4-epimerase/fuculose-1-phosphate aldolase
MDFSFTGTHEDERFTWFAKGLRGVMEQRGHRFVEDPDQARLVVNFFRGNRPRTFRRRQQSVFLAGVADVEPPFESHMAQGYPLLIRSLSNLFIALVPSSDDDPDVHFVTPEQGHYVVPGNCDRAQYFERVYERIEPLAESRLVIDNIFETDLPEELWDGDEITESIYRAGKRLAAMDLLPAPFPMHEILSERDIKHIKRLYGLGGLSYGNVSARLDDERFWMSASGVDKSNLREIGRDILLVKDYDADHVAMRISVPPHIEPRRASVDAIEHWMIYREHPDVGAILHVHAWMEGIPSTEFNYPCGTRELGQAVANLVRQAPDPSRCVIGLKNHGLTITGRSLDEIFERIEGKILKVVPMS